MCRFEFRPATVNDWEESVKASATAAAKKKAPTQEHLLDIAEVLLLGDGSELGTQWKTALSKPYRKANGELADYSTLKGQLNNYTKKNTYDYFIHKDLGGFLTRELDFYIKNELMQWEDLVALKNNPARLAPMLSKLDVIRDLGGKIITFLAQLENFQKKLWLKKKFVTETNYCITLDRVPEALYSEICDNQAQLEEWIKLFAIDEIKGDLTTPAFSKPLTPEFLHANQNLVLDTQFFSEQFKAELVASIEDFDEQCDGLLVHSENFQALNLLQERYREQVKCIYIDPPYNTSASEIIYKNSYKSSSWLSFLKNRVVKGKKLLNSSGIQCTTIDDFEYHKLKELLITAYGAENIAGVAVIKNNPAGRSTAKGFSIAHEYAVFTTNSNTTVIGRLPHSDSQLARYNFKDQLGAFEWVNFRKHGGANANRHARPRLYYPIFISNTAVRIPEMEWDTSTNRWVLTEKPLAEEEIIYPITPSGEDKTWKWGHETANSNLQEFGVRNDQQGNLGVYIKSRINKGGTLPLTVWDDSKYSSTEYGTNLLRHIFGKSEMFSFPKSLHAVSNCLLVSGVRDPNSIILDYFSGSGTTGHAVINLNREDGGSRKYILAEMGSYFDTVLKPRLAKVAYADKWKNGKPESRDTGISHCFKYIRLESYEDTLGNLTLNTKQDLFSQASNDDARQAYVMNYMLDVETRGSQSLLNIEQFTNPTEYQLNVRSASGDETVPVKVDLLETFNYLLGLEVEHIAAPMHFDAEITTGEYGRKKAEVTRNPEGKWWFRTVYGKNRNGQYVLVVWRNLPSVIEAGSDAAKRTEALITDNAVLDAVLVERLKIRLTESLDDEIDILYVNGDNNIAIPRDRQGNPMEQARVQLIEDAFKRLMFADTEAVH